MGNQLRMHDPLRLRDPLHMDFRCKPRYPDGDWFGWMHWRDRFCLWTVRWDRWYCHRRVVGRFHCRRNIRGTVVTCTPWQLSLKSNRAIGWKNNRNLQMRIINRNIHSKWFEPRSIISSYSVIVRVRVVLKRTVVGDWRFDNLSGSHLHSQVNSVCLSTML